MHYIHVHIISGDDISDAQKGIDANLLSYQNNRVYDFYNIFKVNAIKDIKPTEIHHSESYDFIYDYAIKKLGLSEEDNLIIPINKDTIGALKKIIYQNIELTKSSFNNFRERFISSMITKGISSFHEFDLPKPGDYGELTGYYLKCFAEILSGDLQSDTFFYDWEQYCCNTTEDILNEYAQKGDKYVVFIDLHN